VQLLRVVLLGRETARGRRSVLPRETPPRTMTPFGGLLDD
jgi:hypothetical protein